jgi:diketogulonate reductase-like aldo/keto reductase
LTESHHHPDHVQTALEHSLKNLGLDYVDLYLVHWPFATEFDGFEYKGFKKTVRVDIPIIDTWRAMEKLVDAGLARSIGVSNFTIPILDDLLSQATIPPAVNQVELRKRTKSCMAGRSLTYHSLSVDPYLAQVDLVEYSKKKGIVLTG